ncbi:glycine cleavage system protein T [Rhizorhabdus dicambivorans]|uniref:Glycine cleavage system protein T n=3 Tax=Sphingomonadaceae TaxID=41297 RepID=A0A2A4FPS1_9SPHN|nr:aminomethyltransferase family protein [Rhizorhabdus dicambivorans]ALK02318.1 methyltransferase [Sphingomonas sp. Ndbn-20]AND95947.1 methyltransferase [synthetic construct]ATE65735.1 glycine cleavage system protein T [Rhizorhabdus dicambivorans]PCE39702.1 glycine cleavage system protein T [Rhizorhabdus dicambivorans]
MVRSVQDIVDDNPDLVNYFKYQTGGYASASLIDILRPFIPAEFTNWREEQRAWHEAAVMFDQSHHMSVTYIKGPDAKAMLNYLSPSTFSNLSTDRGKQYFVANPDGKHIGDCVLHYYGDDEGFELISGNPLQSWVRYHCQTGEYNVEARHDPSSPLGKGHRRTKYRFQLEGPNARQILDDVCVGGMPELQFFRTAFVTIAGCRVHILRHGMAGHTGAEISGPWDEMDTVRDAILKAGEKLGLRRGGTWAYYSATLENGWIPTPFPAIYTSDAMKAYREWLPAASLEGQMHVAGSYYGEQIEDYYWDAWSLGYDKFVKFDHDFIGRAALEKMKPQPHRVKRLLVWNEDDVMKVMASQFGDGPIYKAIDMPLAFYGLPQADDVRSTDGRHVGVSQWCGYTVNEHRMMSLCGIDEASAAPGTEVVITWGERNGGAPNRQTERHEQTTIRATVALTPADALSQGRVRATL